MRHIFVKPFRCTSHSRGLPPLSGTAFIRGPSPGISGQGREAVVLAATCNRTIFASGKASLMATSTANRGGCIRSVVLERIYGYTISTRPHTVIHIEVLSVGSLTLKETHARARWGKAYIWKQRSDKKVDWLKLRHESPASIVCRLYISLDEIVIVMTPEKTCWALLGTHDGK